MVHRSNVVRAAGTLVAVALVLVSACGEDDASGSPDAGVHPDAGPTTPPTMMPATPALPAEPAPPAPPMFATCPTGWRAVTDADGIATCDPWPAAGASECDALSMQIPGAPGCAPIGSACPADGFPADVTTAGDVWFVQSGAVSGNGTRASPFATIAEALALATSGDLVAVARGTYAEAIAIPAGVEVRGACAAETTLTSAEASTSSAVVTLGGAGSTLRDVRVADAARPGVRVTSGANATIRDALITGVETEAVRIEGGATLTVRDAAIRDTRAHATGTGGLGIVVAPGATLDVGRAVLERNRDQAISLRGAGSVVRAADVAIRDTQPETRTMTGGRGLDVQNGSRLEAARVVLERNHDFDVAVVGAGSSAQIDDVLARETRRASGDPRFGRGLTVELGASVVASRLVIEDTAEAGILVFDGATGTFTDLVVRRCPAWAVLVHQATAEVERGIFEGVGDAVVYASMAATITLRDLVIRDVVDGPDPALPGFGIEVVDGSSVDAQRLVVERAPIVGILVMEAGSVFRGEDVVVRDTAFGRRASAAVHVEHAGGTLELRRALLEGNTGIGAESRNGTLLLEDTTVRDTGPALLDSPSRGVIAVGETAQLTATRVLVERTYELGIGVGPGATATLADVTIRDMLGRPSDGHAAGFIAQESSATVDRMSIANVPAWGMYAAPASIVRASDLTITNITAELPDGGDGFALVAKGFADLAVDRLHIADVVGWGVLSMVSAATVIDHATVERIESHEVAGEIFGGSALIAADGGALRASDFAVRSAALCGVEAVSGGQLDLAGGLVTESAIGACIDDPAYDIARLSTDVVYADNGAPLDSRALPTPALGPAAENPFGP